MQQMGMNASETPTMTDQQATRPLDGKALAEIERSLHGRLRAHHVSDSFFDRHGEDAVQRGVVEYLRARADGVEVREPRAFVLQAAFRRAIDELRREARRADGASLDQMLESGRQAAAPAEDEAITNIEARRLQKAIDSLPADERRVLALHYFEDLGQQHAAELLYMSERTFRRRLKRTLAHLARLLDAPAPGPGSHRGLEIGLAAWAGLDGGGLVTSSGGVDNLAAALESRRALPGRILDRLRVPGTRLAASEVPERVGAIAGGPAGKVLGGCAGAAVVCVLSGVVGPGLDLGGGPRAAQTHPGQHVTAASRPRHAIHPILVEPGPVRRLRPVQPPDPTEYRAPTPNPTEPAPRHQHEERPKPKKTEKEPQPSETEEVEEQFSGVAQATAEAETETSAPSREGSALQETAPAQPDPQPEPSHAASEERQVEEQFRGPLG
jgi:RNA polymerase sigma-70 factor (ECF subfamily)